MTSPSLEDDSKQSVGNPETRAETVIKTHVQGNI